MRFIIFLLLILSSFNLHAQTVVNSKTFVALSAATGTGAGTTFKGLPAEKSCQSVGATSAGAGAATILIQVSNDGTNWLTMSTHSLTLSTTASSDGAAVNVVWRFLRANVTAISGTGASVTVTCAYKF